MIAGHRFRTAQPLSYRRHFKNKLMYVCLSFMDPKTAPRQVCSPLGAQRGVAKTHRYKAGSVFFAEAPKCA